MKDTKLIFENFKNYEAKILEERIKSELLDLKPLILETNQDWIRESRLDHLKSTLKPFDNENKQEELNEILGFSKKEKLIKKIKKLNPDMPKSPEDVAPGSDEVDQTELEFMSDEDLEAFYEKSKEGKDEFIDYDDRGFFSKVVDKIKGLGDVSLFGKGSGLLIGGDEVLDVKKRSALKGKAKQDIENQLAKLGYEPLTNLYKKLGTEQFPNNDEFGQGVKEIQSMYEELKQSFKKKETLGVVANSIVAVMRSMVIYFQDYTMNDKFYYVKGKMDEIVWRAFEAGMISEASVADTDVEREFFGEPEEEKLGAKYGTTSKNYQAAYSKKFPVGLALGGLTSIGLGYAIQSPWVQEFIKASFAYKRTVNWTVFATKTATKTLGLGAVQPGEGLIHVVRRLGDNAASFGKSGGPSMGEVFGNPANEKMKMLLEESLKAQAAKGGVVSPNDAVKYFNDAISQNADPIKLFTGQMGGTGKAGQEIFAIDTGTFEKKFTETVTTASEKSKEVVETTDSGKVIMSLTKQLGAILGGLGVGMLGGAAASAAMRIKGKHFGSRARVLHDLGLELKDLVDGEQEKEDLEDISGGDAPGAEPEDPGVDPQPETPQDGAEGEVDVPPKQRSRLILVRLNDDGIKFHPGRNSKSEKQRGIDRDVMKKAQDQGITGANTDPDQQDLRNRFGTQGVKAKVKDTPISKVIQVAKKKIAPRSKRDAEPYITVGDEIYKDLANAFKKAGLIKTARLTNKVKASVDGTIEQLLGRMVKSTPPKKLTWKQAQPTLIKQLRKNGLGETSKNSKAVYEILRALQEYGLIRGEIPEDPVDVNAETPDTPISEHPDVDLYESLYESGLLVRPGKSNLKEWKKLSTLFKK